MATEGERRAGPSPAASLLTTAEEDTNSEVDKAAGAVPDEGSVGRRRNFPGTCEEVLSLPASAAQNMDESYTGGTDSLITPYLPVPRGYLATCTHLNYLCTLTHLRNTPGTRTLPENCNFHPLTVILDAT